MKENRYFQMVYLLLERGNMTAPELAEYFEVSVRTIYRDIDILSSAGVPIYATQGKGGGISIQDNFVLEKSVLSEHEQKQILMALQGIRIADDEYTKTLLSKLNGVFQKQNVNWLEIDFSSWTKSGAGKNNFQKLKSAIFESRIVTFHYYSGKGEIIKRVVEPLKLVFKSADWYLYGYCSTRNDFRFFKLTRIRDLVITDHEYTRSIPNQIFVEEEKFEMQTIKVTLLFDKSMSFRVYDKFDDEVIQNEDGSFLVETVMPNNELLFSYILSCGDKVEVISPQELRNIVSERAKKILVKYIT